jgi:hypothetical protein
MNRDDVQALELIARIYAECGMKRLFKLLLKLIIAHPSPKMIRRRGEWTALDPSPWNANMDVLVNVGLGHGMAEDRMMALSNGMTAQLKFMELYGPTNPFVTPNQLATSVAKVYELAGFKDSSQFINKDAQLPPPPPPKPTPEEILAEVEREKTRAGALETAAKIELDRDTLIADTLLKATEIRGKYPGVEVDIAAIRQSLERDTLLDAAEGEPEKPEPVGADG